MFIDVHISFYWQEIFTLHILRYIGWVETRAMPGAKPQSDKYQTLAQFYANIKDGKPLSKLVILHYDLICFQSRIDTPGQEIP